MWYNIPDGRDINQINQINQSINKMPLTAGKTNKWVLDQIKHELSVKVNMLKLRLPSFGPILRRQDFLEKTNPAGKGGRQQEKRKTQNEMD